MKKMSGENFAKLRLKRNDKVRSQAAAKNGLKIRNEIITVNPQQLFNRIICVASGQPQLKTYFRYELAPRPPSLFDEVSLRKGTKASLVTAFDPVVTTEENLPPNATFILDGGHILHTVVWPRPATYRDVLGHYVSHVVTLYSSNTVVVFDGYPDTPTTKGEEHRRGSAKKTSADIIFDESMQTLTSQKEFLSNSRNKVRFIAALKDRLSDAGITAMQAEDDADTLIVSTALERAKCALPVAIVGQDTDLLVLMISLAKQDDNIWFLKRGTGNKPTKVFSCQKLIQYLGETRNYLLFAHAITGCDTTSALHRKGKIKALRLLQKKTELQKVVQVFSNEGSTKEDIAAAGETFLLKLYDAKGDSLDEQRYFIYSRAIARQSFNARFVLATLPPK